MLSATVDPVVVITGTPKAQLDPEGSPEQLNVNDESPEKPFESVTIIDVLAVDPAFAVRLEVTTAMLKSAGAVTETEVVPDVDGLNMVEPA